MRAAKARRRIVGLYMMRLRRGSVGVLMQESNSMYGVLRYQQESAKDAC